MLVSLYLRNFRRFDEAGIDFNGGVNGVFGANYQGKSTLLLAIAVALAGPAWARGFNLTKRGQDNFELQLVIELESGQYRIVRTNSGAKLFKVEAGGDRLLANQQGNVNAELSKLIGMPVSRFLELRFIRQKQASTMFEAGAAKLNTLVEELTGVNTISNVIDQLGTQLKTLNGKLDGLRENGLDDETVAKYEAEVAECKADGERLREEKKTAEVLIADLESKVATAKVDAKAKAEELSSAREAYTKYAEADAALQLAEKALESADKGQPDLDLDALTAKADACHANAVNINEIVSDAKAKAQVNASAQADKLFAEQTLEEVTEKANTLSPPAEELDEYEAKADAYEATERQLGESERDLKRQIKALTEAIANGVCKACNRAFEEDPAHRQKQEAELEALKGSLAKVQDQQRELEAVGQELHLKGTALQAQVDQYNATTKQVEDATAALAKATGKAKAALAETTTAFAALTEASGVDCRDGVAPAFEKARRLVDEREQLRQSIAAETAVRRTLARLQGDLDKAKAWVASRPDDVPTQELVDKLAAEAVVLVDKGRQYDADLKVASGKLDAVSRELSAVDRTVSTLSKALDSHNERLQSIRAEEAEVAHIESLRKFLRENRSRYLQAAWTLIMARASTFAESTTEGFISEIRRTEQGSFEFVENGEVAQVCDASGAQAAILGIAVQVALAETVPSRLNLLLADEPTADMDAEHSSAVAIALSTVSKQVVLISHHRMDESVCDEVMEL